MPNDWTYREPFFQMRNAILVEAGHAGTPVNESKTNRQS
jgi:hypothetical protein